MLDHKDSFASHGFCAELDKFLAASLGNISLSSSAAFLNFSEYLSWCPLKVLLCAQLFHGDVEKPLEWNFFAGFLKASQLCCFIVSFGTGLYSAVADTY